MKNLWLFCFIFALNFSGILSQEKTELKYLILVKFKFI